MTDYPKPKLNEMDVQETNRYLYKLVEILSMRDEQLVKEIEELKIQIEELKRKVR